jgi:GR25 family glycosyltransferase involved in LPS biosynthesis
MQTPIDITGIKYINLNRNWHRHLFLKLHLMPFRYPKQKIKGVIIRPDDHEMQEHLQHGVHYSVQLDTTKGQGLAGCWIAHSHALQAIENNIGITAILEDDFICTKDFFSSALRLIKELNTEFDVIIFDPVGTGPLEIHKVADGVYQPRAHLYPYYYGTHCLFINNASKSKILAAKQLSQLSEYEHFLLENNAIKTLICYTGKSGSRNIGSDILIDYKPELDLTNILLCLMPYFVRKNMTAFKRHFYVRNEKKIYYPSIEEKVALEGYYQSPNIRGRYLQIVGEDHHFIMKHLWDRTETKCYALSNNEMFCPDLSMPVKFIKDADGKATSLFVHHEFWDRRVYEPIQRSGVKLQPSQLQIFQGKYRIVKDVELEVVPMDDHLVLKQLWDGGVLQLIPESELTFFSKDDHTLFIKFIKNNEGAVINISVFEKFLWTKI